MQLVLRFHLKPIYLSNSIPNSSNVNINTVSIAKNKIVTRFAPSPTGVLHMGGVRTALFSYLFAKQAGGEIHLRIEDTDKERNREEWTDGLIDDLAWLGLIFDTISKTSDNTINHRKHLESMISLNLAYVSKEQPIEPDGREEVIRFRNPNKVVTFSDLVRGEIKVDTSDLGDFVIAKSLDEPLFHLAVVADDFGMGISHVIRAEEHISNTPRQILIQEAIGAPRPIYAHLPLILAPDRSKLSKRKHADIASLTPFRTAGYLPSAILNFVALLGWNPGTDKELFTLDELGKEFDMARVQKSGAIFDIVKLNWLNREHIKILPPDERLEKSKPFLPNSEAAKYLPLLLERIDKFGDIRTMLADGGEFDFLLKQPVLTKELLIGKSGASSEEIRKHLTYILEKGTDREIVWPYAKAEGKGKVLWPMRVALSGKKYSPDPFTLAKVLGLNKSRLRIKFAIDILS